MYALVAYAVASLIAWCGPGQVSLRAGGQFFPTYTETVRMPDGSSVVSTIGGSGGAFQENYNARFVPGRPERRAYYQYAAWSWTHPRPYIPLAGLVQSTDWIRQSDRPHPRPERLPRRRPEQRQRGGPVALLADRIESARDAGAIVLRIAPGQRGLLRPVTLVRHGASPRR